MKKGLLFIALMFCLGSARLQATHVAGAEITYVCAGNGKYDVFVKVYRDCNGIPLSVTPVEFSSANNAFTQSPILQSVRDVTGISPACPQQSRCSGSYQYGFEEHIYKTTVDLSSYSDCNWTIVFQQCCRNSNITTGQNDQNFYVTAQLDKCVTSCNSSPHFNAVPKFLLCNGQDVVIDISATDTSNPADSLSYALVAPLQGAGNNTTYSGSFTSFRPLTFFGYPNQNLALPAGFHLDPASGLLSFRPTLTNQVAVIVVEVTEWRNVNGNLTDVGRIRRDFQVIVTNCVGSTSNPTNAVPELTGNASMQACAGTQVCVPIHTDDTNSGDTVVISWDGGIPGAIFTNNNGTVKHASGEVCWTPDSNDIRSQPYVFRVTARDNACPLPSQTIRAYSILVSGKPSALTSVGHTGCGRVELQATAVGNNFNLNSVWVIRDLQGNRADSLLGNSASTYLPAGDYVSHLTVGIPPNCINTYIDSFTVPGPTVVWPTLQYNSIACQGDTDSFTFSSSSQLQSFTRSDGRTDALLIYDQKKNVEVMVNLNNGCSRTYRVDLDVLPVPTAVFAVVDSGKKQTFFLMDTAANTTYTWHFHDSTSATGPSATKVYNADGQYLVKLVATHSNGCSTEKTTTVSIVTGIDALLKAKMQVYPNPFSDEVKIITSLADQPVSLTVTNAAGKRVMLLNTYIKDGMMAADLHTLAPGTYFLQVDVDGGSATYKIVKTE